MAREAFGDLSSFSKLKSEGGSLSCLSPAMLGLPSSIFTRHLERPSKQPAASAGVGSVHWKDAGPFQGRALLCF